MNEVELLTIHARAEDTVVYAGAAPGNHLRYLAKVLFPLLNFVLIDPAPFNITPNDRIILIQELMTDAIAEKYSGRDDIIFLSDIRRTHGSEELISQDMADQQRWHDIIRPRVSMLKFRLPWQAGMTEYLDGKIYLQPYIGLRSTETRLVVQVGTIPANLAIGVHGIFTLHVLIHVDFRQCSSSHCLGCPCRGMSASCGTTKLMNTSASSSTLLYERPATIMEYWERRWICRGITHLR